MLVLSRQVDEKIMVGDDIEITIVDVRGAGSNAKVRVGISAPRGLAVHRKEVYDAIQKENTFCETRLTKTRGIYSRSSKCVGRRRGE